MSGTPIDTAHAALEAAGDHAGLRLAFYGQVMAAELYVILEAEPEGEQVRPLVLETAEGRVVLAFDLAERMADFADDPRDYIAVSGRSLAAMLAGQGIGIALNPDVAPSASIISAEAVGWLAAAGGAAEALEGRIGAFQPPVGAPAVLVAALEKRLGAYSGRVDAAFLATAQVDGHEGLVLALEGVPEAAERAVAAAVDEAVRFSGSEGTRLHVLFPPPAILARIARVGLAFRPKPPESSGAGAAPSVAKPPRLR